MYNKQYYQEKNQKLQQQNQKIIQRLVNAAFDFVNEITDLQERSNELKETERLSIINEATKGQSPPPDIAKVKTDEKAINLENPKGDIEVEPKKK